MKRNVYYCRYSLYKPDPLECRIRKTLESEPCRICDKSSDCKEDAKTLVQLLAKDSPRSLDLRKRIRNSVSTG